MFVIVVTCVSYFHTCSVPPRTERFSTRAECEAHLVRVAKEWVPAGTHYAYRFICEPERR